jgi:DNA-binding XRE family transcriptional regulator
MNSCIDAIDAPHETARAFDGLAEFSPMDQREPGGTSELSRTASHSQHGIKLVIGLSALGVDADLEIEIHVDCEPKVKISTILGQDFDTGGIPKKCLGTGKPDNPIDLDCAENRVRELRENKLLTQSQLARKAGVALRTIRNVENGMTCRIGTKRKIVLALGLSFEDQDVVFPAMQNSMPIVSTAHRAHGLVPNTVRIAQRQPAEFVVPDRISLFSNESEIVFHERGE